MGIPGWAMALGAPLAADKLIVDPISSAYSLYKGIRDDQADRNDKAVGVEMLQQFQRDPGGNIDLSRFSDPKAAATVFDQVTKLKDSGYQKQAVGPLSQFATDYQNVAGTTNPRFFADEENRAEMVKAGLAVPEAGSNPYVSSGLQAFAQKGQQADIMANAFAQGQNGGRIDPDLLSSLALEEKLPGQFDNVAQSSGRLADQFDKGVTAENKVQGQRDLASFQRVVAGMAGQAQSPSEQQRLKSTGGYDPNGGQDIALAGADYNIPAETVNKEVDNYRQQMLVQKAGPATPYTMGTGRSTETGLLQNFVLGAPKNIANTTSVAPPPRVTVNVPGQGAVAQTSFVDPASGKPLVFDKKTGSYRVANVEGAVAPKPAAFTPESAAKAQMIEQAVSYIPLIRAGIFKPDGAVDRTNVANMNAGTLFTQGRELRTYILDAVEAKLRAESGAAVPEPEVKRAAKRFFPSTGDKDSQITIKLNNLESYLKGTAEKINIGRDKGSPTANARPIAPAGIQARVNGKVVTSDGKGGWN